MLRRLGPATVTVTLTFFLTSLLCKKNTIRHRKYKILSSARIRNSLLYVIVHVMEI